MKKLAVSLLVLLNLSSVSQVSAEESVTFGLGVGSLYSGLGGNIGLKTPTDMKYLSAGCVSYSTRHGETCGLGAGWVHTDVFDFQTPNHGLGVYLGIVGTEQLTYDHEAIYGVGVGYHYFFSGIDKPGVNLGFMFTGGDTNDGFELGNMIQIGYQF